MRYADDGSFVEDGAIVIPEPDAPDDTTDTGVYYSSMSYEDFKASNDIYMTNSEGDQMVLHKDTGITEHVEVVGVPHDSV